MPFRAALVLTLALVLAPAALAAERIDFGVAIDQVGRLRMLSQRIVKAYCQIGLAIRTDEASRQLGEALEHFDSAVVQVQLLAAPAAADEAIGRLEEAWRPFRSLAAGPVSPERAARLQSQSERVLEAADGIVLRLKERSRRAENRLVNLAGRQRMLTQRLAKLHLLRAYGLDSPDLRAQSLAARKEFYAALATLQGAPENTADIAHELQAVAIQWEWLRHALAVRGANAYAHGVAEASERILERMERVTALYAALAGS